MAGRGTKSAVLTTVGSRREKKSVQPGTKGYKKSAKKRI